MITIDDLKAICPVSSVKRMELFVEPLNAAMREFDIDNPMREAAFLAQLAHESGGFHYVQELASGAAYEGRSDLGNAVDGDGVRFKGRGLIQITGRANYQRCSDALGEDFVANPAALESPVNACRSAAWFWKSHGLNELADSGDFVKITRRINGGTNGLADRQAYWERSKNALA